jgi:fluoride exporter
MVTILVCKEHAAAAVPDGERMATWAPYLLVGLGGFLGALSRFVIARAMAGAVPTRFPLATFCINVGGSFLLGVLAAVLVDRAAPNSEVLRLALGIGFLGAFTTFSTFELETHLLLNEGAWMTALLYVSASCVLGLLALRAGIVVGKAFGL